MGDMTSTMQERAANVTDDQRADIARKRNIDRLCRLKSNPLFFDDGLGEVFTRDQFERSTKP